MYKPIDPKPDFPKLEKSLVEKWHRKGIVKKYLNLNTKPEKIFAFLDGPITANNPMGVHHAWGRTFKDLWQKFYNLLGYKQRFQNGFDCQGLWVEVEVEKELNLKSKKDIENLVPGDKKASIEKFVELCKERVIKYSKIQTNQSKRLGYFMDWDNSYFTMSDENNYMIWHFLKVCHDNDWIYKGEDAVPWCPRCETAISQHEMLTEDYKKVTHDSIYLSLPIVGKKREFLLVWTTTAWTIPANVAVAVDGDLEYSLVETNTGDRFWTAKDLIGGVFGNDKTNVTKTVMGSKLVGMKYTAPFDSLEAVSEIAKKNINSFHKVIATDSKILPVSTSEGTGLIHIATGAGTEDFRLGKKYNLPILPIIEDNANFLSGLGFLTGKNAKVKPEIILDYLKSEDKKEKVDWAFDIRKHTHRYPACWRCKEELVWKVEEEWYIAMDRVIKKNKKKGTLRKMMIKNAKKANWIPKFGLARELDWLKNMDDWLISKKNRYWGVALPIWECKKCGNFEVLGGKEDLKTRATKGWEKFEGHTPHKPWIDEVKIKCPKCYLTMSRIDDVGNPWLDAGIVPFSSITKDNKGKPIYSTDKKEWKKWFPADFITESFPGQFKNWFYSLIAMSTVLENEIPFKTVLGFGTLLAEDGRPMHKSWGNSIEFDEGAKEMGVDIMRWMYCSHNPADNLLFGYKKADEIRRRFYLMLWNSFRYFVEYVNLDKIKPSTNEINLSHISKKNTNILDYWIINRFILLREFVDSSLREYNARDAVYEIERFVNDLSRWYIRRSRKRVWFNSDNRKDKQNFYQTLFVVLRDLSIILSPFMPFISDIIYTHLTSKKSVHCASWPKSELKLDKTVLSDMELVRSVVEMGHRIRKKTGIKLRQPLSNVQISIPEENFFINKDSKKSYIKLIKEELNVKRVEIGSNKDSEIHLRFNTGLTEDLIKEGKMRELIRLVQKERKKQKLIPSDTIVLTLPGFPEEYRQEIARGTCAVEVINGKRLKVSKI